MGPRGAQLLADASALVGASQDEGLLLRDLVGLCLKGFSDWAVVYLSNDAGATRRFYAATAEPGRDRAVRAVVEHASGPAAPPIVQEVVQTCRGRLTPDLGAALAEDGTHRGHLREMGEGGGIVVPVHARGRVLGVLALASRHRPYGAADVSLAEALGRQIGLAIDNARLLAREQKARLDAEAAANRVSRLQAVTAALSEALTPAAVGRVAVDQVLRATGAYGAALYLVAPGEPALRAVAREGNVPLGERVPLDAGLPLTEAVRLGHACYVEDATDATPRYRGLASLPGRGGQKAIACIPFLSNGRGVGGLWLGFREPRRFPHEERGFLEALARQCAQAVERARLFESEQRARSDAEAAAAALRASEALYRLIAENTLDMISRLAPDGTALYVSPACRRLLGFEPEELAGRRVESFIHPEDRLPEGTILADLLGPHDTYTRTYRRVRKDGSYVWFEMTGHGVRDPATGALREIVTVSRDVTERRRAEQELEASRRQVSQSEKLSALGSLVSGVAHEIRTPLAYISNHLFLVRQRLERGAKEGEVPEALRREVEVHAVEAAEGADRINSLVKDLSRFIRQAAGPRAPMPLQDVVADAVRLFQATHRGEMAVESDLQPTPRVSLDRVQVQQVVLNLLENAYDAAPRGRARVSTRPAPAGGAELLVEDWGPGIPPEVQARMFDPFFTTKKEGTGLGLSIVRRIAETHGATVRCDSTPGRGTRFVVSFPPAGPPKA